MKSLLLIITALLVSTPTLAHHTTINIRGINYVDHSHSSQLLTTTVHRGQWLSIRSSTFPFIVPGQMRDVRVILQDVNSTGLGVTAFRLTNIRIQGNIIMAQLPTQALFANRSYYLNVFSFGAQPFHYLNTVGIRIL